MNWFLDLFGSFETPTFQHFQYNDGGRNDPFIHSGKPFWLTNDANYWFGTISPKTSIFESLEHPDGYPSQITRQKIGEYESFLAKFVMNGDEMPQLSFSVKDGIVHLPKCFFHFSDNKRNWTHAIELTKLNNTDIGFFYPNFYKNDLAKMAAISAINSCDINQLTNILNEA